MMPKFDPTARRAELIRQITVNQQVAVGKIAEAQSYAPARELLIDPKLGLGIPANSIVVDAPVPFGRERPDIQIWLDDVPVSLRNESEHLFAILELKSGSKVRTGGRAIARSELATYNYSKLRHFYLADGEVIQRYDLGGGRLPQAREVDWTALEDEATFVDFFSPITADRRSLRRQLEEFSEVEVPLGKPISNLRDRRRFIDSMVTVARILSRSVDDLVDARLIPDLKTALDDVAKLSTEKGYGVASFDFTGDVDPVIFEKEPDPADFDATAAFNESYTRMLSDIEPRLYALRAENIDLPSYARRSGLEAVHASFLKTGSGGKARDIAVSARASFVQETSALLFSRLLMVRFSEDHRLLPRVLSNGGLAAFANFAKHTSEPFQLLIRTAYDKARQIYRHLFERKPLDWLLYGGDASLSDALLHAMWILAGWDFTTVRGDILSGIYDRNLDRSQRQALGEVYTRPELAAYMLSACGYDGTQDVLDPACGSGTFLVEAFEAARQRKVDAGLDFTADDAIETIGRLHGLDLNAFSATLAQIQLLWHALAAVIGGDTADLMRKAIVGLSVEGGHSSLSTWGVSAHTDLFGGLAGRASEEIRAHDKGGARRLRTAARKFRDLSGRRGGYPIVAGNPPFVRFERAPIGAAERIEFAPVLKKNTDLSVLFVYRAMEWWLAPEGRLGFFLPLALSEASYAEPLRAILARYRIVEIIDLEEIGNVAFHGANVVTIGLVMEKTPATAQDQIKITRVTPECLDEDHERIDMTKAITDVVPRSAVMLERYLPGSTIVAEAIEPADQTEIDGFVIEDDQAAAIAPFEDDPPLEAGAGEEDVAEDGEASDSAWLTKIRSADVEVLDTLAAARRLDDIILRGWTKKSYRQKTRYEASIPSGEPPLLWQHQRVMGYGVKVGRKSIENAGGRPVYKAKHLPPDGSLPEAPFGHWNGDPAEVDTTRFYSWAGVGDEANTFVVRNIATQPVFAPHPANAYLTNTVYCIRLSERFPLNIWSLSRVVAWFMAKTARTSVVQGYFTTFYPRQTTRIPIPGELDDALLDELDEIGNRILAADDELARGDTEIERLRDGVGSQPFRNRLDLVTKGIVTAPKDVSWPGADADWAGARVTVDGADIRFVTIDEDGSEAPAPTETGQPTVIAVNDADLREWAASEARSLLARGGRPDRQWMGALAVPDDPATAATLVRRLREGSAEQELAEALDALDRKVADVLGISDAQLKHILDAFANDAMLRHVRPQWKHRRSVITRDAVQLEGAPA